MLFKVVNQFKKHDDEDSWKAYMEFSGLEQVTDFCSLDSSLNDSVFEPESNEDWNNCVNEDYKTEFITNLDYAKQVQRKNPGSQIFGLIIDPQNSGEYEQDRLLGFDIVDGYFSNSLLTNCGGYPDIFENEAINQYGLIDEIDKAYAIRNRLRMVNADSHAEDCEVIAVYDLRNEEEKAAR
jgi:hypothetical protein